MEERRSKPLPASSVEPLTARRRSRPWTVRALGLVLLLQAAAYVALSIYLLLPFDWRATAERPVDMMPPQQIDALSISFILLPAAILAVLSAIGFLFLFRAGWILAVTMQGATLLGCLALYFDRRPQAIFPVMLYCIVMAFFLNSFDVRIAFCGGTADHEP
jgi:hypothetical protein